VLNAFSKHTDGSIQWNPNTDGSIQWNPKKIVGIGEDFHNQVEGYDKKDDTREPITHLQGYPTMVKLFKESHAKDLEKLAADRLRSIMCCPW
jgi:hypothetical protein